MKIITQTALSLALLATGFAAGFPVGKDAGFTTGSEWALRQANLLAREAGVFMPVYLEEGQFRVVIRQPRNIYKRAWQLADENEERAPRLNRKERSLRGALLVTRGEGCRPQRPDNSCRDLFVRQAVSYQNDISILRIQREPFRKQVVYALAGPFGKTAGREIAGLRIQRTQGYVRKDDEAVFF